MINLIFMIKLKNLRHLELINIGIKFIKKKNIFNIK